MVTMRDAQLEDAAALCAAEQAIVARYDGLLVSDPDELYESAFRDRIRRSNDSLFAKCGVSRFCASEIRNVPISLRDRRTLRVDEEPERQLS